MIMRAQLTKALDMKSQSGKDEKINECIEFIHELTGV